MKEDKKDNAPNICLITERFNDVRTELWELSVFSNIVIKMCRLIVSEIVTAPCMTSRVEIIGKPNQIWLLICSILDFLEKWAAVADICRCLHNFNGVLQVCAAFTNSSVFRLKETWKRVSKTVKYELSKLQAVLIKIFFSPRVQSLSCKLLCQVMDDIVTWETLSTGEISQICVRGVYVLWNPQIFLLKIFNIELENMISDAIPRVYHILVFIFPTWRT